MAEWNERTGGWTDRTGKKVMKPRFLRTDLENELSWPGKSHRICRVYETDDMEWMTRPPLMNRRNMDSFQKVEFWSPRALTRRLREGRRNIFQSILRSTEPPKPKHEDRKYKLAFLRVVFDSWRLKLYGEYFFFCFVLVLSFSHFDPTQNARSENSVTSLSN